MMLHKNHKPKNQFLKRLPEMSLKGRKATGTWLFGFLTLLSLLNAFNAIIQLNSGNTVTNFRIFNAQLGSLNAEVYFWISIITTFVLFGVTSLFVYRGLPVDPLVLNRLTKVEENLSLNQNMLENTQIGFFRKLEESEKANEEIFRKASLSIEDMKKENSEGLTQQKTTLKTVEEETKQNGEVIKKQAAELVTIKKKIDKLLKEPARTKKARLASGTNLSKFKSMTPRLATKLNGLKINTVSELLASDPAAIAERASEMVETIATKQSEAQLLMVPGIDEKHAKLLVKAGITSRKELADQDPIQLYRSIAGMAKTSIERGEMTADKLPTIEDVSEWTRQARL